MNQDEMMNAIETALSIAWDYGQIDGEQIPPAGL